MGRHIQHTVSLTGEEKAKLETMSKDNELSSRLSKRVLILLALNNQGISQLSYRQISDALHVSQTTIVTVARDFALKGVDYAVSYHYNSSSAPRSKINGALEANVIQLACSKAPQGHAQWSLELLTEAVNKRNVAEPVSRETIRVMLKKMNLGLT